MSSKKNFKENPTAFFISDPEPEVPAQAPADGDIEKIAVPLGYKIVPEAKSRRTQILVRPTMFDAFRRACDAERVSVNEKINQLMEDYLKAGEGK